MLVLDCSWCNQYINSTYMQEKLAIYVNIRFIGKMTTEESRIAAQIREEFARFLRMFGHKSQQTEVRTISFAFQNAISQIPDTAIQFLIDNPSAKLRIQKIKPQTDDNTNASHKAKRRGHTS